MARKIIAAVLGVIAAFGIVAAVEALGHTVYPVPPDIDFKDPVAFGIYVQGLPVGALLFPAGAWGSGHTRRRPSGLRHRQGQTIYLLGHRRRFYFPGNGCEPDDDSAPDVVVNRCSHRDRGHDVRHRGHRFIASFLKREQYLISFFQGLMQ